MRTLSFENMYFFNICLVIRNPRFDSEEIGHLPCLIVFEICNRTEKKNTVTLSIISFEGTLSLFSKFDTEKESFKIIWRSDYSRIVSTYFKFVTIKNKLLIIFSFEMFHVMLKYIQNVLTLVFLKKTPFSLGIIVDNRYFYTFKDISAETIPYFV